MVLLTEIPSSSSSTTNAYQYDVFLSFRGLDTRLSFTNHLYEALVDANLTTFFDDEEIETGEQLKPELESAIKSSRASIIVLSKNYASSTWCLDELVLILEQKMKFNQIVIPIFYHVEPTDVRKQQSSFGDAMAKHKQRMDAKMELWKRSLTEVAGLKGKDAKGRKETELIEEVVTDIHHRLGVTLSNNLPFLVGMDHNINRISSWLRDGSCHTVDILTIVGMSGIGKTSLAKYVFQLHSEKFHKSSFIEGITARCNERFNGLLKLQKQLYGDISKKNPLQVNDVSVYTSKIENALARKRVFVVLDDIGSLDQMDSLLGNKGLHPGSKIIITTKDASLTERCVLFKSQVDPNHIQVLLNGLCMTDSLHLLCVHAFKNKKPKEGYKEVSENLVKYCDGHSLVLEFLGKSLHKRNVAYWEECIKGLKKEPHSCIKKALEMSIDSLPSKDDKDLFKYIACFFVGTDRDVTEIIMNSCDICTSSGITNLSDRCLLSIGLNNELLMHQLVQDMGKDLVRRESPHKPWERSQLWCHKESFEVLKHKKGTENVLGLALDMRMLEKEQLSGSLQLKTDALNKMANLKLLQLNYVKISGSFKNISKELRWLCMQGMHFKSLASELPMENLVVLDMSHSSIESFDMSYSKSRRFVNSLKGLSGSSSTDKRFLGVLKILDLSFCEQLRSLCGFFELPVLERLIISNCTNLVQVCESIKHCAELVFIDMSNCKKLRKLPRSIGKLKKLQTLVLNGCDLIAILTEMGDIGSLKMTEAKNFGINSQTSAVVEVVPRDLRSSVSSLPTSIVILSLSNNNLSSKSFPTDFSSLSMLEELYLDDNPIVSMPSCVRTLSRLKVLSMNHCQMLETVEYPPSTLTYLLLVGVGDSLREIKFNIKMSELVIDVEPGWRSCVIEGMAKVQPLAHVEDEVLCSLGWANFELIKYQHLTFSRRSKELRFRIQMYYEFGIFSTIYQGEEMPNWISCRSKGSSITFTIPSSPNKLKGLNLCFVLKKLPYRSHVLPMINVSNLTNDFNWCYRHYLSDFRVAEECLIFLSHWMFGKNEMEDGDQLSISVTRADYNDDRVREWGIGLVFDDGRMKEDGLGYYKSWNHIIGGDLSAFGSRTRHHYLLHDPFFPGMVNFRAFSEQEYDLAVHQRGDIMETTQFRNAAVKIFECLRTRIAIVEFIYTMFRCSKVKTRSHLCFSLKLYTCSRFFHILYFLLVIRGYD